MDSPYADGRRATAKARTRDCLMCSSGNEGESAFFFGHNHLSVEEAGPRAALAIRLAAPGGAVHPLEIQDQSELWNGRP